MTHPFENIRLSLSKARTQLEGGELFTLEQCRWILTTAELQHNLIVSGEHLIKEHEVDALKKDIEIHELEQKLAERTHEL